MKWLNPLNSGSLYVEIRQRSFCVSYGAENLVIPIERQPTGRLTGASKDVASRALRTLLKKKNWQPRARAFCAIEARGVSLRRLSLPASLNGDIERVLRLQIENEFPLPPESLAWGYSRIEAGKQRSAPGRSDASLINGKNDFTVVALKKELLDDYTHIFAEAGTTPVFTVAALARSQVCPQTSKSFAVLDIGRTQSELSSFTEGNPDSLRVLSWGGENLTRTIEQKLGISLEQAEDLKLQCGNDSLPNGEITEKLQEAIKDSLATLARSLAANWNGERLYLTGRASRFHQLPQSLAGFIPGLIHCERIDSSVEAPSAAILGLKHTTENDSPLPIVLRQRDAKGVQAASSQSESNWLAVARAELREIAAQPALMKWVRLAILLCFCSVVFPYAQAFLLKPFLAKKLAKIRAESGRLAVIDRELTFLQYLKNAQPPYLDALTVLANSAPPGTRFDSVTLNRRGELALKGNIGNAQQVVDFRTKLIKSAFFSSVTVEEQTPSPDRQRMTVRILAQCKPAGARPPVKAEPLPAGFTPGGPAMPFPGMMPGGPVVALPPGGMPPSGPVMSPPGVVVRDAEGSRAATRSFQTRYGLPEGVNPEAPKPVPVEEAKPPGQ
jgi:Tfp pilus assembly PilM family ATPase